MVYNIFITDGYWSLTNPLPNNKLVELSQRKHYISIAAALLCTEWSVTSLSGVASNVVDG